MLTVQRVDLNDPEHAGFMYDLAVACQDEFLNDYQNDIIDLVGHYQQELDNNGCVAFLCLKDGEKVGIIWVELENYEVGVLRGGLLPEFRKGFTALGFFRLFVEYLFDTLNLRKLTATMPTYNKAAEALIRRLGFTKRGFMKAELLKNRIPVNLLYFELLKEEFQSLKEKRRSAHVQIQ